MVVQLLETVISETCYNSTLAIDLTFQRVEMKKKIFLFDTVMSWDFFVPISVGDLVKTGGINQYVVQDVVPPKHLPASLSSKNYTEATGLLLVSDFIKCRTEHIDDCICPGRVEDGVEESGASVYSGALRHRLQCPAVSFDFIKFAFFVLY